VGHSKSKKYGEVGDAAVLLLYVGIIYGGESLYHRGHRGTLTLEGADNLGWFYSPLALSDIFSGPVLQLAYAIGHIIGLVVYRHAHYQTYVQNLSIDKAILLCDSEAGSDGSGAGGSASGQEKPVGGETRNGLQLCGQWPTVWVTSYRGLRRPEVR
jgi:hypothetical protein